MTMTAPENSPQPTARRRNWFRRHKFLTVLLVLAAIVVLVQLGGDGDSTTSPQDQTESQDSQPAAPSEGSEAEGSEADATSDGPSPQEAEEPSPASAAGVGDTVSAGDFEYTVTSVKPGVARIGDATFGEKPQGQFVLVGLTVTNTGSEAQMFSDSENKLVDTQGREHSADSAAAVMVPGNDSFLEEINPGNTLKGIVVFDVPKGAEPAELKLVGPGFWNPDEVTVSVR